MNTTSQKDDFKANEDINFSNVIVKVINFLCVKFIDQLCTSN